MTKQVNQLNEKQIVKTSSNPSIILTKTITFNVDDHIHKPSTQQVKDALTTRPNEHNAWAQEFGMKKIKFSSKIKTKKAERGSKSLTLKKASKEFQPSIPDSLNIVQSQPMTFKLSSGQFNPPKMLYFGFHPLTNQNTPKTPTVTSPPTVGTFIPPSKYLYGFKPIYANNKLP